MSNEVHIVYKHNNYDLPICLKLIFTQIQFSEFRFECLIFIFEVNTYRSYHFKKIFSIHLHTIKIFFLKVTSSGVN